MLFCWLPDPEHYAHPRLSWFVQFTFGVAFQHMFRVEHDLPDGYRVPPGAMVVSNHLRDTDAQIVGTTLGQGKGVRIRGELPYFAMREDLFQRGALANLVYACPRPFIHVLRLVPMNWVFANVRTLPMRRLREFTWHDTLRDLCGAGMGARDPATVFNARGLRELRGCLRRVPARIDAIHPWRMGPLRVAHWGLRRLQLQVLRELAPGFRATVERQLAAMAAPLDAGYHLYFAPEGGVSMDGHFGRVRAGTWRIGRMLAAPLVYVPLTLTYDPLRPGRTRVILRRGEPLRGLDVNDSRAVAARIRQALLAGRVVTPSHLLAYFLATHPHAFATHELVHWVDNALALMHGQQLEIDAIFQRMPLAGLVEQRLRWLRRKRVVRRGRSHWHNNCPPAMAPGWHHPAAIVRYLANALAEFAPALVKALPT